MARRTVRTTKKAKQQRLLDALRAGDAVGTAAAKAGIARSTFYAWRDEDAEFAAEADAAIEYGTDVLEDVAYRRAVMASDTLMIFLLKARRPERYRETTRHEHTGPDGGPVFFRTTVVRGDDGR